MLSFALWLQLEQKKNKLVKLPVLKGMKHLNLL